ncbi:MAG: Maf family protein [Lachnospiraceae bacterium]|nr:Maf family protein [Lachnospiraceae bacterium]
MNSRIILASSSPRRKELMEQAGYDFFVLPAKGEEKPDYRTPEEMVRFLSMQKATEVAGRLLNDAPLLLPERFLESAENLLVIGADTVVSLDQEILGKPGDRQDAARMLAMLSGRCHEVWTGVTVIPVSTEGFAGKAALNASYHKERDFSEHAVTFAECTTVDVAPLSEREIREYLETGEADDKAGAYGIQGRFAVHIRGIRGDYCNVVGLPIASLYRILSDRFL